MKKGGAAICSKGLFVRRMRSFDYGMEIGFGDTCGLWSRGVFYAQLFLYSWSVSDGTGWELFFIS
jgi:hypothetical protein